MPRSLVGCHWGGGAMRKVAEVVVVVALAIAMPYSSCQPPYESALEATADLVNTLHEHQGE